ncbi:hypothetical protein QLQ12_36180 [Actinoplanes sp. NEAU-A12]|uniref:Uncharacterized protein n=1 Tax=Actinoplanes sandaracinus TaxID=3045177 RepID=A0ABT6WWB9_9ACTN|nr:hypothetical protein [Actinoplanes sandaracinus]MDI6104043.1 hypothetical protein [Actinoplanes sandaracinus]
MDHYDPSPKALRTLMTMYWSAQGWRTPPVTPAPADLGRAVAAGVMFDRKRSGGHDEWVAAARRTAAQTSAREVGDAFLESLGSRRLDLRSALGSYAVARALPDHGCEIRPGNPWCVVCGQYPESAEDLDILNFERFKWGGVRHYQVPYAAFDLEQFARAPRRGPDPEDMRLARELVEVLRGLPPGVPKGRAAAAIGMLPGNRDQRDVLLDVLALAGIWRAGWCSPAAELLAGPDRPDPAPMWGVDERALREYLPALCQPGAAAGTPEPILRVPRR